MRKWLEDADAFEKESEKAGGSEKAWQNLLETNPWILGVGLGGQLLTSWDKEKLEQITTGASLKGAGKRVDALLKTNGIVSSMVFAEIKHHRTDLLSKKLYRSSCWAPSNELAGAVVQVQQSVRMAVRDLGEYIEEKRNRRFSVRRGYIYYPAKSLLNRWFTARTTWFNRRSNR